MTTETCTCTTEAKTNKAKILNRQVTQKGRLGLDLDGNYICTVDSFGFRSQIDGECQDCYAAYIKGYNEFHKNTYDDD